MSSLVRKFDLKNAKQAGVEVLGTMAGFVGAYQAAKLTQKNTLVVNAGLALAGVAVATMASHPFVQCVGAGVAVYGGIKAINNLSTTTTPVTDTKGVDGIFPQGLRDTLAKAFPALGEVEDFGSNIENRMDEPVEVRSLPVNGFGTMLEMSGSEMEMNGSALAWL